MQIALNVISILAFVLSVFNFFLHFFEKRKNLKIKLLDVIRIPGKQNFDLIHLNMYNHSKEPLVIYDIKIFDGDLNAFLHKGHIKLYECKTVSGEKELSHCNLYSQQLPMIIDSFRMKTGFFVLITPNDGLIIKENYPINLVLYTSKGKIKKFFDFSLFTDKKLLSEINCENYQ